MGKRNVRVVAWLTLAVALPLVIASLFPISYPVCPNWDVTVVDNAAAPVSGMTVRRVCQDYSIEATGHEDDAITDKQGKVSFERKYLRSPKLFGWAGNVLNVVTQGAHASFGRHAHVFAFGRGMEGTAVSNAYVEDWTGSPEHMESKIVVKPVDVSLPRSSPNDTVIIH